MNVILISPHFPENHINYARALKRNGFTALGIGDEQYPKQELLETLHEYCYVENMTNYDRMLRTVAYLTSKYGKIDRIESHNEFWLGIDAKLREDFNIFGQKTKDTDINRSKLAMKTVAQKAGIKTAPAQRVESLEQTLEFANNIGYPVILKPIIGVGAAVTYAVHSGEELRNTFARIHGNYLCEKFINGTIVTYDGLTDADANIRFETSHEYENGVIEMINHGKAIFFHNVTKLDDELRQVGHKCIKAFDVKERFFHVEFFRTPENEYILLEINVRPPGLCIIDMMNFSADIDLYDTWAKTLTNNCNIHMPKIKYCIGYLGRKKHINYKHSDQEIFENYKDNIIKYAIVPGTFANAMGDDYFLIKHPIDSEVKKIVDFITET